LEPLVLSLALNLVLVAKVNYFVHLLVPPYTAEIAEAVVTVVETDVFSNPVLNG
jgi:hypothetical protein